MKFYITPYSMENWLINFDPNKENSTFQLNHILFREKLTKKFSNAVFYSVLTWELKSSTPYGLTGRFFGYNNQNLNVEFGNQFYDFVLWYRTFVPTAYPLMLFKDERRDGYEITSETTTEDLIEFTGNIIY